MDKSWIHSDRRSKQYEEGVEQFIKGCLQYPHIDPNLIHCPCCKCINLKKGPVKSIREHLYFHGFSQIFVCRYIYASLGALMPKISGVVKIDLSLSTIDSKNCTVASRQYGPKCYVAKQFSYQPNNPETEEYYGYLVTFVHREITPESKFVVMDAKSPTLEIVVAVRLPQRVSYGLYGIFVRDLQMLIYELRLY